jgi:hypothetical protein
MKAFFYLSIMLLLLDCSSVRTIDSWVNKDYTGYSPKKILVVGLTDNITARKVFEEQLVLSLEERGIHAVESFDVFKTEFTSVRQTEENIQNEVERLAYNGFDAILISAVKGVKEKVAYSSDIYRRDYYWRRFRPYYYMYQDIYLDPSYYEKYNIYNIEATLYDLKEDNVKSLVWVASYDIVDPKAINTTVKDYVKSIIKSLENEAIISSNVKQ